ncbi:MAG TPA: M23 family metallopeptidase, partial [Ferruginibacter sp.]|nr:M23 family metallopeptidase [Ferruginibacter sp.]
MKILFYSVLLLLCFAGKAQTGIGFFTTGELRYPHRVDINSNSNPVYINENKNVSLINKIFQSNYTAYNFTTTGFITGEYTQTNGYGGCSHKGIDYRATTGTAIYAVMNGIVTADGTNQYGTIAIYNAAENITVLYLHCSSSNVINGANVTKGAKIGESGNTSPDNIAAHLHFELRQGNTNGSAAGQCASINSSNTYDPRILDDIFTPTVTLTSPINNAQQHSENINFS